MSNTNPTFHSTAIVAVNEALVALGQDVVLTELSRTSSTVNSRKAAFTYESSRLRVLKDHNWNFAKREYITTTCNRIADGVDPDFQVELPVPPKASRILACYDQQGDEPQWKIIGKNIRASRDIVRILYIADIDDLDKWSPDAYRALVLRLAADLAKPITGRINERQLQEQAYEAQLANAKLVDSKETHTPEEAWGDNFYADAMRGRHERTGRGPFGR